MSKPLVSVVVLTYNGEETIKDCLNSVLNQSSDNIELIVVDNASRDKTREILANFFENGSRETYENCSRSIRVIENKKNVGFAGHNVGIENTAGEFVLCMNQDVVLDKEFISEAVKLAQQDEKIGAVQGKLLKKRPRGSGEKIIDTTGHLIFKSRRIVDRGQGKKDNGQYDKIEEVFGVNGAVSFFRKACLEDVKISVNPRSGSATDPRYEYYDQDFFMYKEDVDLSWRIRLYGWKIVFCPTAIAYVERTSRPINETSGAAQKVIKTRRQQTQFVKSLSFKNYRLAIIKNDLPWLFIKHLPWILPREISAWLYVLFLEPGTWPAIINLFRQIPRALKKRKIIMKNKKAGVGETGKWFI